MEAKIKVIRVSSKSPVPQLSGSIVASVEEGCDVEVRAVGASAVNQMYKAITSARGILATKGKDLFIKPGFDEISENGEDRTVMVARIVFM
ncbi:MAG: Stage V sporulation protein S [Bacteriophage sp.]|jgi:stage V sporulation protein S|nr:MAG: Stage V sporulation protein S [Bacteriophage sp.]DAH50362.1 MAG TPA: Stage V sporulation protein S (SpoVS) [Caudoviricetes sp.]